MSRRDIALRAQNIQELEDLARRRLPRLVFDFIARGAEDEATLKANREAFGRLAFLPRILRDVQTVDLATPLFGRKMAQPLMVAPIGGAAVVWLEGEAELARAAAAAGVPFVISSASTTPMEKIAEAGGRQWFQLYPREDPALTAAAVDQAQALGCEALVLTVDTPVTPNREYNRRNGFSSPVRINATNALDVALHPAWAANVLLTGFAPARGGRSNDGLRRAITQAPNIGAAFKCDALTWEEAARWRRTWRGPFLVKGIVSPLDAEQAVRLGADAIVVSNHGGRNLEGTVASLDALPAVLAAVAGRIPVLVDGGVRRGSDVVKALALGAAAVLVGRAPLYGLAAAGRDGAGRALAILGEETARVMGFCGAVKVADLVPELVVGSGR